jgi:hypothetical protein
MPDGREEGYAQDGDTVHSTELVADMGVSVADTNLMSSPVLILLN